MSTRVEELRNLLTEAAKGAIDEDTKDHIEVALTLVRRTPTAHSCRVSRVWANGSARANREPRLRNSGD